MLSSAAQGAHVLQMFPFGWMKANGTPHREEIYLNMVEAANCTYSRWVNKRWDNAFLRRCDGGAHFSHDTLWLKCAAAEGRARDMSLACPCRPSAEGCRDPSAICSNSGRLRTQSLAERAWQIGTCLRLPATFAPASVGMTACQCQKTVCRNPKPAAMPASFPNTKQHRAVGGFAADEFVGRVDTLCVSHREDYIYDNGTAPYKEHPEPAMVDPRFRMWEKLSQHTNQVPIQSAPC